MLVAGMTEQGQWQHRASGRAQSQRRQVWDIVGVGASDLRDSAERDRGLPREGGGGHTPNGDMAPVMTEVINMYQRYHFSVVKMCLKVVESILQTWGMALQT